MENTLKLVGKSSNEIFTLRYPSTLVDFCEFDFSFFAQEAIEVCNAALKTGIPDFDKISEIKKDIQSAHCYMQYSTRTAYDKIVFDCWIDYVCRRDNIGNSTLWNRFIRCRTQFEKIIFQRLCDFRYKRAVNEWLNVIRIQDYAKSKIRFVFPDGIKSAQSAEERKNYFDLMFSVTARELGCRLDDMNVTKYYSIGRTPGAPFMYPSISKEIVRHVLAGFDYTDDYSDITDYSESADEIAMDAFSRMKAGLPQDLSSYAIPTGKLENLNDRIYMPCGLKAAVDLEIDAMLENGMWLTRCRNCGRYFGVTEDDYKEYCSRRNMPSGKTCIEIYEEQNPRPKMTDKLLERCDSVTDDVYARVGDTMSVEEFNSWRTYLEAMKEKVENGEILPAELENFLDYSLDVDITKSKPIVEVPKREPEPPRERVVRPFVPERISRSEIQKFEPVSEPEEIDLPISKPSKEGFFTSPSVQRQKSERPQISHIIRNGEPLGDNSGLSANSPSTGFQSFEAQYQQNNGVVTESSARVLKQSAQPDKTAMYSKPEQFEKFEKFEQYEQSERYEQPKTEREQAFEQLRQLEERLEQERRYREERAERNAFKPLVEQENAKFVEDYPRATPPSVRDSKADASTSGDFQQYGGDRYPDYERITPKSNANSRIIRGYDAEQRRALSDDVQTTVRPKVVDNQSPMGYEEQEYSYQPNDNYNAPLETEPQRQVQQSSTEQAKPEAEPKPRVIKKNAAAISAYGKMSGQSVTTVNPLDRTASPTSRENVGYEQRSDASAYSTMPQSESYTEAERYSAPSDSEVYSQRSDYGYDVTQQNTLSEDMLEPFKDIETIFDVLEQSESGVTSRSSRPVNTDYRQERRSPIAERYEEPDMSDFADLMGSVEETLPEQPKRVVPTRPLRNEEAPAGFWTEDRGLFRNEQTPSVQPPYENAETMADEVPEQEEKSELELIREKRHSRSSKTQRLYDVIMREPDDNPNFRKKK